MVNAVLPAPDTGSPYPRAHIPRPSRDLPPHSIPEILLIGIVEAALAGRQSYFGGRQVGEEGDCLPENAVSTEAASGKVETETGDHRQIVL